MKNALNSIGSFLNFSALHPTLDKCEVAGIGVLKNVNVRLAGIKIANLTKESIKILGVHASYEEKVQDDLNFCKFIKNLCNVIKLWRIRRLSLENKIAIFKLLAILKIALLEIIRKVPNAVIEELKQIFFVG